MRADHMLTRLDQWTKINTQILFKDNHQYITYYTKTLILKFSFDDESPLKKKLRNLSTSNITSQNFNSYLNTEADDRDLKKIKIGCNKSIYNQDPMLIDEKPLEPTTLFSEE